MLDQPTKGMDIFDTFFLVEYLRQWAGRGNILGPVHKLTNTKREGRSLPWFIAFIKCSPKIKFKVKWNVSPLIRRGSNFFVPALYCSCLGFNALLASPMYTRSSICIILLALDIAVDKYQVMSQYIQL